MTALAMLAYGAFRKSKNRYLVGWTLVLSIMALVTYGYYESGIPSHYAIRVDLLLIAPALAVHLFLVAAAAVGGIAVRRKAAP